MPSRRPRQPVVRRLALSELLPREDRATVLSPRARKALADQIARHGRYPALVVRPHPHRPGRYEILDGHHRAQILRDLGESSARCEVWPVGPVEAEELAATLNRLRGRQAVKRGLRQLRRLVRRLGASEAASRLGMTPRALRQQLDAGRCPRGDGSAEPLPLEAVVFHLSPAEASRLREALGRAGDGKIPRAKALMKALGGACTCRPGG